MVLMNTRYLRYIRRSPAWQALRRAAMERDGYRCQVWLAHPGVEVHHRTYARLYHEDLADLITLCRECHQAITTVVRRERHRKRRLRLTPHQRILPVPVERKVLDGVSLPVLQNYRRRTPDHAQWANQRPAQSVVESLEKGQWQTHQNGRRS
jgi:hypothetical protein